MSGFFGIVRTDGAAVEQTLLDRIGQSLEFRGPDGTSTWRKNAVGFCFTLLDTQTAHQSREQPVNLAGRYCLVGEVRLDCRRELVTDLRANGERLDEETPDAELVLHSWRAWGEAALAKIAGDFSFALWDAEAKSLCCARDFTGARPFYFAEGPGFFCFSNTLQILCRVPGISSELDDVFVRDFLLHGLCKDLERTVWRRARRLRAGFRLNFSDGKADIRRFVQLPIEEPLRLKHSAEYLEKFRELLERGVADRLPLGRVSLYLSGGMDSATVCATAARLASKVGNLPALKAFTVSCRPLLDDPEPEFAKLSSSYIGLEHEILEEEIPLAHGQPQEFSSPEPSAELFLDRSDRLYRRIAAHSRVVLSGDGGDNVLEGQAWPYLKYLWARGDWKSLVQDFGAYFKAHGKLPPLRGGFRVRLGRVFHSKASQEKLPNWLNEDFSKRVQSQSAEIRTSADPLPVHPTHPDAYERLHSGYWASVLEEEDTGWTRVHLETRAPLLDLRLLKFLFSLPPVPWCVRKEMMRQAMRDRLPVRILRRPKTPLLQDLLEAVQQKAGWRPTLEKKPPQKMAEFVKWSSWLATLENSKGLFMWENSYPLCLSRWLKGIENESGIQ